MGTGHAMRCLAVAEALRAEGAECLFASALSTPAIDARLEGAGFTVLRMPEPPAGAGDLAGTVGRLHAGAGAVVLDGYHFGEDYRAGLKAGRRPVLIFDDLADERARHAGIIVNAALHADRLPYGRLAPGATLLLGPRYAPLRQEVVQASRAGRQPLEDRRSLMLILGGSDPLGLTEPLMERLAPALPEGTRLTVVVGGSNPGAPAVLDAAHRHGRRVEIHVDTQRIGALMARSGLAVSAAGGTTAELMALGVPMLLVVVADNQSASASSLAAQGWCDVEDGRGAGAADRIAERALELWRDPKRRAGMADRVAGVIDGEGSRRIALSLLAAIQAPPGADPT